MMVLRRGSILGACLCAVALAVVAGQTASGAPSPARWIVFSAHPNGGTGPIHLRAWGLGSSA